MAKKQQPNRSPAKSPTGLEAKVRDADKATLTAFLQIVDILEPLSFAQRRRVIAAVRKILGLAPLGS